MGNCKRGEKKESEKTRDGGSDGDVMTSVKCRDDSALRRTDVRDGEVEKNR